MWAYGTWDLSFPFSVRNFELLYWQVDLTPGQPGSPMFWGLVGNYSGSYSNLGRCKLLNGPLSLFQKKTAFISVCFVTFQSKLRFSHLLDFLVFSEFLKIKDEFFPLSLLFWGYSCCTVLP